MRQLPWFILNVALALILAQSVALTTTKATESELRASPLIEQAAQKCLAQYILKSHENSQAPGFDILTIKREPDSINGGYIADFLKDKNFIRNIETQNLNVDCKLAFKISKDEAKSELLGKTGNWPTDRDEVITNECSLSKAFQEGTTIIVQYFCLPARHRSLAPDRSRWCAELMDNSGWITVFKKRGTRLTLEGTFLSDDADMTISCHEEKDPRPQH